MDIQNKKLLELPYSINKKGLMALYLISGLTERQIRDGINAIIAENRKLPATDCVYVKLIWHTEFAEFVELYGPPKGYSKEFKTL